MANALQAVLNKAAQQKVPEAPELPPSRRRTKEIVEKVPEVEASALSAGVAEVPAKTRRPSRTGTRLIGGHFPPEVARQLRMLAAEEDTTVQALLEEAIRLLFVKKGKAALLGK